MSDTATIEVDVIALIEAELARLRDASAASWQGYFTWFTWFFTTQMAVLSLIVGNKSQLPHLSGMVDLAAAAVIMLNLLGVIAALRHRAHSRLQQERAEALCRQLGAFARERGLSIEITSGYSNELARAALGFFIVALWTGVVVWSYVAMNPAFG